MMHAVIFDIDGTLLESASVDDALYKEAVVSVLGDVRFRACLADYDYVTDSGVLAQVLEDNGISHASDDIVAIKSHFVKSLRKHISDHGPFPEVSGAGDILESFHASNEHSVAIATGGWRESAQLKLASAGLDRFDFPLSTSDDAFDRKEIMRIALGRLGSDFHSVTYYGDGVWDREASLELGWQFVAVGPALGGIRSFNSSQ
jgi:phosphoglycolate phosphatase-like HAD superfamily hydrolase